MENDFQYRLQKAIAEKGVNASELSALSGVGKADISNYINGKYIAKQDKCFLLAKALDVDPGWLMTGDEPTTLPDMSETIRTPEARILAKGIDKMPPAQREAIINMMQGLYPGLFEEGDNNDDA